MIERLEVLLNEWWKTGRIEKERAKEYRRDIFFELKNLLKYRQITILTGLRRVGKSTLMFQLIDELLKNGAEPEKIVYYTYDEKKSSIIEVLDTFQKITGADWKKEKIYIFLDEIQKLKDWSSQLKIIYDNFPKAKFFVSGSASIMLEKEAMDNLAGRYFLLEVPTLSIKEYFELKYGEKIEKYEVYKRDLELEFEEYIKKPFPEIVTWKDERKIFEYIKESVISKIVRVDLPEVFGNVNFKLLENLLEIFFSNPGMILNLDALSRELRIHKKTLEQHIYFLEFSKLVRILKNFRISRLSESRKLKKIYPYDISLAFPFSEIEKGKVFESLFASKLNAKNYWRNGSREVDFILRNKEILPIEVKIKEKLSKDDLKNLEYLIKKYKIKNGIVIYFGATEKNRIKKMNFLDFLYKGEISYKI